MKTICKLSWVNKMEYNEFYEIAEQIEKQLKENNLITEKFSVGNFCINGIPSEIAEDMKVKFAATHINNFKNLLESEDIKSFKVGDKVKVFFENAWAQIAEDKGTIYDITESTITVKKYRSKTKGYILQVGQVGKLELGW